MRGRDRMFPKVSVIMPAYNADKTINTAIQSVLSQTFSDFELIVIDDCSNDRTSDIINSYNDKRIIYTKNIQNSGASASRNIGISKARGEWIAFLDSDDFWDENKLSKQLQLHNNKPDAVLSYTASAFIDQDGKKYSYVMPAEKMVSYKTLLKRNVLSCSSVMIRADIIKNIKMPGDYMSEDYYTWLMVLQQIPYAYGINEPLLTYRLSTKSKSSNRLKAARMTYETYKAVGYSKTTSFLLTLRYAVYSIRKRNKIRSR